MNQLEQLKAKGNLLDRPAPRGKTPRKRIPRQSPRRAKQLREYAEIRGELLKAHPWCQIWLKRNGFDENQVESEGCIEVDWDNGHGVVSRLRVPRSEELHHPAGRIGEKLIDKTNLLCVSRKEHVWLHAHPSEARRLGLLK